MSKPHRITVSRSNPYFARVLSFSATRFQLPASWNSRSGRIDASCPPVSTGVPARSCPDWMAVVSACATEAVNSTRLDGHRGIGFVTLGARHAGDDVAPCRTTRHVRASSGRSSRTLVATHPSVEATRNRQSQPGGSTDRRHLQSSCSMKSHATTTLSLPAPGRGSRTGFPLSRSASPTPAASSWVTFIASTSLRLVVMVPASSPTTDLVDVLGEILERHEVRMPHVVHVFEVLLPLLARVHHALSARIG